MINLTLEDFTGDYVTLVNKCPIKPYSVRYVTSKNLLELNFKDSDDIDVIQEYLSERSTTS